MGKDNMEKVREVFTDAGKMRLLAAHVWRHFQQDRCFEEAASLGYTSLLSIVPLLAVVFGVAAAFPVFEQWSADLQAFIFKNMVPTSGEQVQEYLTGFLASVSRLTLPGMVFLILTALLLMMRIEKSFNLIWRVPVSRGLLNKVVMYWAVLTLGPLALGAATALSAQPLFELMGMAGGGANSLRTVGIFTFTWLAFCLMFLLVPNCKVPIPYAAAGALVSTILFSLAKTGFVVFVSRASFNVIYGALATIPIFLFWLYLVWTVILLGASLAASLTTFSDRRSEWRWPWEWEFLLVYRILGHLLQAQQDGKTLATEDLLDFEPGVASSQLQHILVQLMNEELVTQDQQGRWLLKRDLGSYSLLNLYRAGEYHLPVGKSLTVPSVSKWDPAFMEMMNDEHINMDRSLKSMYLLGAAPEAA